MLWKFGVGADLSWDFNLLCYCDFCTDINPEVQVFLHAHDMLGTGL